LVESEGCFINIGLKGRVKARAVCAAAKSRSGYCTVHPLAVSGDYLSLGKFGRAGVLGELKVSVGVFLSSGNGSAERRLLQKVHVSIMAAKALVVCGVALRADRCRYFLQSSSVENYLRAAKVNWPSMNRLTY
jgi:hypothetical protein